MIEAENFPFHRLSELSRARWHVINARLVPLLPKLELMLLPANVVDRRGSEMRKQSLRATGGGVPDAGGVII